MIELVDCPLCRRIIHQHDAIPSESRATISSRSTTRNSAALLTLMMEESERAHRERVLAAERACVAHYEKHHRTRLWLWHRLHWNAIMNRRWLIGGEDPGSTFEYGTPSTEVGRVRT